MGPSHAEAARSRDAAVEKPRVVGLPGPLAALTGDATMIGAWEGEESGCHLAIDRPGFRGTPLIQPMIENESICRAGTLEKDAPGDVRNF